MRTKIKIGDRVGYKDEWLRSTGQYAGDVPFARGTVASLKELCAGCTIATITWENYDGPNRVHVANLRTFRAKGVA